MTGLEHVEDVFLARLLQKANIGVAIFNKSTFELAWHNETFAKLCSIKTIKKRHSNLSHHLLDFFFPHDEQGMDDLIRIAIDHGTAFDNRRYILKGDRAHFPADIRIFSFSESFGTEYVALEVSSLSQHVTMEKSEFKRQKLESVVKALNDGILVLTPDLRVSEESSQQAERILGRHDIVGKTFSEIFNSDNCKAEGGLEAWEITLRSVFMLLLPSQAHDLLATAPTHIRYRSSRSREEKHLRLTYAPISVNNTVAGVLISLGELMETSRQHDKALAILKGTKDLIAASRIAQEVMSESLGDALQRFVQRKAAQISNINDFLLGLIFLMAGLPDIAKEVEKAKSGDTEAREYLICLQEGLQHMLPTPGQDPALDISEGISRIAQMTGQQVEVRIDIDADVPNRDRTRACRLALVLSMEALATRIERESARLHSGKTTPAFIRVRVEQAQDKRVEFKFVDDGAPYDTDFLVAKAIQDGVLTEDANPNQLSSQAIRDFIVKKGLYPALVHIPMIGDVAAMWQLVREQMPEVGIESISRTGNETTIDASWVFR